MYGEARPGDNRFIVFYWNRVGELVNLNIDDIDLEGRECIVYGKGDKERRVYFDAKAKVHLQEYIERRQDNNQALFCNIGRTS